MIREVDRGVMQVDVIIPAFGASDDARQKGVGGLPRCLYTRHEKSKSLSGFDSGG